MFEVSPLLFVLYKYNIRIMEANYDILPKRNGKSDGSFKNMNSIKFFTNYFEIALNVKKSKIYQYSFSLPE